MSGEIAHSKQAASITRKEEWTIAHKGQVAEWVDTKLPPPSNMFYAYSPYGLQPYISIIPCSNQQKVCFLAICFLKMPYLWHCGRKCALHTMGPLS